MRIEQTERNESGNTATIVKLPLATEKVPPFTVVPPL